MIMRTIISRFVRYLVRCLLLVVSCLLFVINYSSGQIPTLKIQDTTIAYATTVDIPIIAVNSLNSLNIQSFQLRFSFSSGMLQPTAVITSGTLLETFGTVTSNLTQSGYVTIAGAGTGYLTGKGVLLIIRFKIKQSGYSNISFSTDGGGLAANNYVNEGTSWGTLKSGSINIQAKPVISVYPDNGIIAKGDQLQFYVSGGTPPYSWKVTDNLVATVNTTGLLTGLKAGSVNVIAQDAHNVIDTSGIVEVRALKISIPQNLQQYPGQYIDVPVNITDVTGLGITSGSFSINYSNANMLSVSGYNSAGTLLAGNNYQMLINNSQAIITFAFSGTTVLSGSGVLIYIRLKMLTTGYASLPLSNVIFNENILAVSSNGNISGQQLPTIYINPNTATLYDGQTVQFSVTNGTSPYSWSVSDPTLATVSSSGMLTALNGGVVIVSVTDNLGSKAVSGNINIYDSYITMPDTIAVVNSIFDYPVYIGKILNNKGVSSFQFDLSYDSNYLNFIDVINSNTLTQNWSFVKNPSTGLIRVAFSGANSFNIAGILAKFRFQLKPAMTNNYTTSLSIANTLINEGSPIINIDRFGSIKATNIVMFNVSGQVTYANTSKVEPMTNTKIYLLNSNKVKIDSVQTDASGNYKFQNVLSGTYSLQEKTSLVWGGCNPVDALAVNRYFVRLIKSFALPIMKTAADVNNDTKVNPLDAQAINRRFVKLIKKFTIADWVFDNVQITVVDMDVVVNFYALCAGDVNADRKF
jgi:hypothetical protein